MSWKVFTLVFDAAPVSDRALIVLLALAEWSQDDGVSWHSTKDIAKRARCSVRRAQEVLKGLATPDGDGRTLVYVRRAKRTTFYQINLDLLERLDREANAGQIHLWKNTNEPVEEPVDDGGNPEAENAESRGESATPRAQSATARVPTIRTVMNRNQPEEPENRKAAETVVETEGVVVIVKKLSAASAFPPSPAPLSEARLAERRRFLDAQIGDLKKRGLM